MINPFSAIKAYFTVNSSIKEIEKEATTMNGTTPGWKTSEFWAHLAVQAGIMWAAVQGFVPPKWAAVITASGTAVYVVARTVLKAVTDVKAVINPPAPSLTVSATTTPQ